MAHKKLPKVLALLDEDLCTGCQACVHVCPVDCIDTLPGPRHQAVSQVCRIDLPNCIGCRLCFEVCPWDCITMVKTGELLKRRSGDAPADQLLCEVPR
jgi:formate hydrogenlyase subunit 6/NADH:ubiquinone oxidoreductase subunit I